MKTREQWVEDVMHQADLYAALNTERSVRKKLYALLLEVPESHAMTIPTGWKLVPVEPTEEMMYAGEDVEHSKTFGKIYAAMIAASPKYKDLRKQMNEHIHSCGYHCDKPVCVKDQRDELVRKYIVEQEAPELSDEENRQAFELVAGEGNLKCKSLERSGEGYKFIWIDQAWKWWKAALLSRK